MNRHAEEQRVTFTRDMENASDVQVPEEQGMPMNSNMGQQLPYDRSGARGFGSFPQQVPQGSGDGPRQHHKGSSYSQIVNNYNTTISNSGNVMVGGNNQIVNHRAGCREDPENTYRDVNENVVYLRAKKPGVMRDVSNDGNGQQRSSTAAYDHSEVVGCPAMGPEQKGATNHGKSSPGGNPMAGGVDACFDAVRENILSAVSATVRQEIGTLKTELVKLNKENTRIKEENTRIKEETAWVKEENAMLKVKINHLQHYSRRNPLGICGIAENDKENCEATADSLLRSTQSLSISADDAGDVHRLGKKAEGRRGARQSEKGVKSRHVLLR